MCHKLMEKSIKYREIEYCVVDFGVLMGFVDIEKNIDDTVLISKIAD